MEQVKGDPWPAIVAGRAHVHFALHMLDSSKSASLTRNVGLPSRWKDGLDALTAQAQRRERGGLGATMLPVEIIAYGSSALNDANTPW